MINKATALLFLGDSVTTDHISPAGSIARNSPAARYLAGRGYDCTVFGFMYVLLITSACAWCNYPGTIVLSEVYSEPITCCILHMYMCHMYCYTCTGNGLV